MEEERERDYLTMRVMVSTFILFCFDYLCFRDSANICMCVCVRALLSGNTHVSANSCVCEPACVCACAFLFVRILVCEDTNDNKVIRAFASPALRLVHVC